jgi:hypothetical protein
MQEKTEEKKHPHWQQENCDKEEAGKGGQICPMPRNGM